MLLHCIDYILFTCVVLISYQYYDAFGIINNVYSVHRNYWSVIDSVIEYFKKVISKLQSVKNLYYHTSLNYHTLLCNYIISMTLYMLLMLILL